MQPKDENISKPSSQTPTSLSERLPLNLSKEQFLAALKEVQRLQEAAPKS